MNCPHCGRDTTEQPSKDLSPPGQNGAAANQPIFVWTADTAACAAAPQNFKTFTFNVNAGNA